MNVTEQIADAILNRWRLCEPSYGQGFYETLENREELIEMIQNVLKNSLGFNG